MKTRRGIAWLTSLFILAGSVRSLIAGGVVSNCDETSLRAAMIGGGPVTFACDGTITLTAPLLITNSVSLAGSGHSVTLSGGNSNQLFNVRPGNTLLLADLTLADGKAPATNGSSGNPGNPGGPGYGGAIYAENAVVRALNCYFRSNAAVGGTGGDGTVNGQTGTGGPGAGGAIYMYQGLLSATNCVFTRNKALGGTGGGGSFAFSFGGDAAGGAVYNLSGTNQFFNCQFASNSANGGLGRRFNATGGARGGSASGGAFYNSTGEVWIARSTFSGNSDMSGLTINSGGGAIYQNGGNLTLFESLLASNTVTGGSALISGLPQPFSASHAFGAGVFVGSGTLSLSNSTLVGNSALGGEMVVAYYDAGVGFGGGVYNLATVQAGNSTLVGNIARGGAFSFFSQPVSGSSSAFGGAIYNAGGSVALDYMTFAGNQAQIGPRGNVTNSLTQGGALFSTNGTATLHGTILANSLSGSNSFGTFVDNGHNLSSDSSCNFIGPGSLNNTDPKLGPLDDYGGPTPTMVLLQGSPAIDGGDNSLCLPTDQRGRTRPFGAACDIGAFESAPPFVVRGRVYGFTLKDEVTVSNGATSTLTASGRYSLEGLAPGAHTITPSHPNYLFAPPNDSMSVGPDRLDVNFKAYHWNALSLEGISNNTLVMEFACTSGVPYRLEASSNLSSWVTVVGSAMTGGNLLGFAQPVTPGMRFYRVVTP